MSFTYNAKLVEAWANERNLVTGSTPHAQLLKLGGEVGELANAILRGDREATIDEYGDVLVVMIILGAQSNIDPSEALRLAYLKIKDRKGAMIDGVFVKEADLADNLKFEGVKIRHLYPGTKETLVSVEVRSNHEVKPTQKQLDMVNHISRFGQFLEDCSKGRPSTFHTILNSGV